MKKYYMVATYEKITGEFEGFYVINLAAEYYNVTTQDHTEAENLATKMNSSQYSNHYKYEVKEIFL